MKNKLKTACLFGGQGSQYIGMGKDYYDLDEDCRKIFEIASEVMKYDMAEFCFYGEEEKLSQTLYSLPSMLTIDLCAYTVALKQGYTFHAMAGFSLGEYAALAASKVVSMPTAFELLKNLLIVANSVLNDDLYSMTVVNLSPEICENICSNIKNGRVRVANYNSKEQVTIAGNIDGVNAFERIAAVEYGAKMIPVNVNRPFHSELFKPVTELAYKEVEHFSYTMPQLPLYMNVTGEKVCSVEEIKSNIARHFFLPVLWTKTLHNLNSDGIENYVECGSKGALCRMVKDTLGVNKENTMFLRTPVITH
ncbi:Malonyl CoA-acyl carrier protein transacylase [Heyndrickxia sporothermodurans]|uniref:[acyl-carrier-protein] S-malonyltransferase n=1 Tax=Heyndrickxia sporothermodurans TaxID=46224 RepID=A0A150KX79_9BACI|nr:ACP S-malonyltransferase [Heyndrickxia sporothermodurans]KYD04316.1 Malonyl CoA-acyl carrier protein transacylase [Heyndrickxia sporothermodurans]